MVNREGADLVLRYSRDLAALFDSARMLLNDDAYAAVLPHLDALRLVIPGQGDLDGDGEGHHGRRAS